MDDAEADDDRRTPAASAWTMPAVSASSSRSGGPRRAPRRAGRRRTPVLACLVGALVLLAGLGAAGPPAPVTAADVLPPPDTSATGATGRLPDVVPAPLPPALPPLAGAPSPGDATVSGSGLGIPETVLAAYRAAATTVDRTAPGCRLTWPLVAGIGKVESGHASGGAVDADGTTRRPILGPQLTGTNGNAAIPDTDGGALDHDATWDRAVGPTQFIPSSWRTYGADGNGDGRADPDNVFDAGLATARYLCSSGGDLADADARHDAVFRYNHSEDYVATVLRWADAYASGALPVPDSTGPGDGDGGLADGGLVDGTPTLAALPSPQLSTVPTTSGAPPAAPTITSSGATRARIGATRSPGPDLPSGPIGAAPPASSSSTSTSPPGPPPAVAATPPGVPLPPTSASSNPATSNPASSNPASPSTPAPTKPAPSKPASPSPAPKPASPSPPAPSKPAPSKPAPSTPAPASTTSPTAPTSAARCTGALPALARASGLPVAQLSAASAAGPGTGRTTCTVRGPRGPLLVAVTAAPGAPAPAAPATGISRTVAGGRTVLTIPASSGIPDDRARTALATLAAAWG